MLRFLQCKHVALLPWKQCRGSNFLHSLTFLIDSESKEKYCFEHMKKRRVVWNPSEFVKTFMITQNKRSREWPTCLALTSVTEQFSNWSSNQVYFSLVMILFLKVNLDNWRRVSVKTSSVFFSCPNRKCTWKLLKVNIKHSSKNGRLHLTAVTNMWKKDCTKS